MNEQQQRILTAVLAFFITAILAYWVMEALFSTRQNEPMRRSLEREEPMELVVPKPAEPERPALLQARQELSDVPFEPGSVADKLYNLLTSSKENYSRELYTFRHDFERGSTQLTDSLTGELDQLAAILKVYPDLNISLECHTDDSGDRLVMRDLSEKQADAMREHLIEAGVSVGQIDARGFGSDVPLTSNRTEEGRAQNRRIEMSLRVY